MPVVGPVVRLWVLLRVATNVFGWRHHFQVNIPYTDFGVFAADLIANWNAACNAIVFENVSNYVFAEAIRLEVADPPSDDLFIGTFSPYTQGQDDFVCGPLNVAVTIRWQTSNSGRSGRGRTYLTGLRPNSWHFGGLTSSAHEWAELYAQAMMDTFGPVGTFNAATHVILSREHDGVPVDPPLAQPVVSWSVNPTQTSMRRRAGVFAP